MKKPVTEEMTFCDLCGEPAQAECTVCGQRTFARDQPGESGKIRNGGSLCHGESGTEQYHNGSLWGSVPYRCIRYGIVEMMEEAGPVRLDNLKKRSISSMKLAR